MKALVVYDSLYGNTKAVAQAVGDAMPGEVPVLGPGETSASQMAAVDLLIIGTPTHGGRPTEDRKHV